jgi:PhoPQ-activated pathogenicity-related protein
MLFSQFLLESSATAAGVGKPRTWRAMWVWLALIGVGIAAGRARAEEVARPMPGPLADYVAKPDDAFKWTERSQGFAGNTHYTEYILTSQTWRGTTWRHQLYIVIPSTLSRDTKQALLVVAGGGWREELNQSPTRTALPSSWAQYTRFAELAAAPVAVLLQVPFQPMFAGLTEDWLIAHTFRQYLDSGDSEWPLLLPMVKSAVKAMDAVQAIMKQEWKMDVQTFTVTGASKRGWTTWLTGAVDPRVTAMAPMVIDVLNMGPQMEHARAVWGAPSAQVEPYTRSGVLDNMSTPEGRKLVGIVDPFSYRKVLTQPKLIINGTNDDYWPVDSASLYWNELQGEKYLMVVPNTGHGLADYSRVTAGVLALHQSQAQAVPMPKFSWEFEESPEAVTIVLNAEPAPHQYRVWTAHRPTRDFRTTQWTSMPLAAAAGKVRHTFPRTAEFQGVFIEADFRSGRPLPLNLSTLVKIVEPRAVAAEGKATAGGNAAASP